MIQKRVWFRLKISPFFYSIHLLVLEWLAQSARSRGPKGPSTSSLLMIWFKFKRASKGGRGDKEVGCWLRAAAHQRAYVSITAVAQFFKQLISNTKSKHQSNTKQNNTKNIKLTPGGICLHHSSRAILQIAHFSTNKQQNTKVAPKDKTPTQQWISKWHQTTMKQLPTTIRFGPAVIIQQALLLQTKHYAKTLQFIIAVQGLSSFSEDCKRSAVLQCSVDSYLIGVDRCFAPIGRMFRHPPKLIPRSGHL